MAYTWRYLNEDLKASILAEAVSSSPHHAAEMYADEAGMHPTGLARQISKELALKERGSGLRKLAFRSGLRPREDTPGEKELTTEQIQFVEDIRSGKKDSEDAAKYILANFMENVFRNPELIKSIDAFRSEMLKIKKEEKKDRQSQAMALVSMMFSGQIPPSVCPKCGEILYTTDQSDPGLVATVETEGDADAAHL